MGPCQTKTARSLMRIPAPLLCGSVHGQLKGRGEKQKNKIFKEKKLEYSSEHAGSYPFIDEIFIYILPDKAAWQP